VRRTQSEESKRAEFGEAAVEMHRRMREWRRAHGEATFDEIAERVSQERRALMGNLLEELATEAEIGLLDRICPLCDGVVQNKGQKKRQILHREGETKLERDYYYCPACKQGFFPSRPELGIEPPRLESGDDSHGVASGS
jgi:uncharacterized protein with PIN domain